MSERAIGWALNAFIGAAFVAMPTGIALAFYTNDSNWLIMTGVAFLFFFAG